MAESKRVDQHDFDFIEILGTGAYGRVVKAIKKDTGETFAIKIVEKSLLKKENKEKQALIEKNILTKLKTHPGIIKLHYTFQDAENLFFVLEYCPNGDFGSLISSFKPSFPIELARFYTAELIFILDQLHSEGIVHRDLKPDNLLLSQDFHLRLSDFGTAKEVSQEPENSQDQDHELERRGTFVGTAEYVSPELLNDENVGPSADLWALGCSIYEMMAGKPPFRGVSSFMIFEQIREGRIEFTENMPDDGIDIVRKLLVVNPADRLGGGSLGSANDMNALKNHPFISGFDLNSIMSQAVPYENMPEINHPKENDVLEIELLNREENKEPEVLMIGIIKKWCKWVYRKRQLIITDEPRVFYKNLENLYKGDIEFSAVLKAEAKNDKEFVVTTSKRSYFFKEILGNSHKWVETINKLVRDHFHKAGESPMHMAVTQK
ncbi:unnamed protein product [Blepharisma stoltei]|uniref:non-specific serine/threonine protein kinase n=1 Tax=Blepharisma stoltei TaxID=1481888 RepID=A0AAU9IYM7_9CILI|nr:unnamed protein product [Blepharisma stoltei]